MAKYVMNYAGKKAEADNGCGYYFAYSHLRSGEK